MNLFAAFYGFGGREKRERVEDALAAVELSDTGEKLVAKFSSGMKQRLLIARALLIRPSILLLDEPTRSLDPISARRFRQFLKQELAVRQRCTVLLATHNSEEALELCDRVGVLHRGQLLAVGTADALSAEISGERYQLWTRSPNDPAFDALAARGVLKRVAVLPAEADDWTAVEVEVSGGLESIAEAIAFLARAGVAIARCERIKLPLADLIEQIVRRRVPEDSHA